MKLALVIALLAACVDELGSTDLSAPGIGEVIDPSLCGAYGLTCGNVYQFDEFPADNPLGLLELCVRKDDLPIAMAWFGPARPSTDPRFLAKGNLCRWRCPPPTRGCNAYGDPGHIGSCFCP